MMGHQHSECLRVFTDEANDAPWDGALAAVTVNEKIDTVLCLLLPCLEVIVNQADDIIGHCDLMIAPGRGHIDETEVILSHGLKLLDQRESLFSGHRVYRVELPMRGVVSSSSPPTNGIASSP